MKKTNFILGITALSAMPALGQTASGRPNIVYILMDDLGFGDIGCYGQEKIETPHIDQLRQEGMRFTQHYTGSPVSAPARCVLMTGMHSGHAQIRYNNEMAYRGAINDHDSMFIHKELEGQYPLKANTMTIGRMMQNAGYTTGCFGKWGLGFPDSEGTPNKQGFNQFYGYNCQRQAHTYYPAFFYNNEEQVGKLIQKLKAENLYDNALIIFTSDNGPTFNGGSDSPWFNSGGWFKSEYGWGKCFLHEGGIRVPAVMVWKGKIKPGSETDHICCFQDVMPTLAEIISVTCPPTDGISFLPTLLGNKAGQKEHEYLYWEYPDPKIGNKAIRMGKWKGIITNIRQGNTEMQLYDLDADLREEHDVAAQHPDIVAKFRQLMEESSTPDPNRVGL